MYWILVPKSEFLTCEDDVDDDTSKYSTKLIKIDASYTIFYAILMINY